MCGIVGFWNLDRSKAEPSFAERMLDRITYRGPDDRGVWSQGDCAMGHVRLSILDLSERGHQPFVTADGQGVLVYNGEVYNFREIRSNLESEGVTFRSQTDTEVVLNALHHWGPEKAIPLFDGMFGFAYMDLRQENLWIARDRAGIKPAYIAQSPGFFGFASEMKSLLAHPKVSTTPDVQTLSAFIAHQRFEGDWTPFQNIEQVSAGSYWKVSREGIEKTSYFDVIQNLDTVQLQARSSQSFDDHLREFSELFEKSVKMHMISDAPLAAMCSGGVDSSLITAVAQQRKRDIVGYVANVKGAPVQEGLKAQRVGKHLGIQIRQIDVQRHDLLRLWPTAIWHGDQPNCHANDMPYILVTQACRQDGIKVMLTGEGSDELFGGYPWHGKIYDMWRLRRLHQTFIKDNALFRLLGRLHPRLKPLNLDRLEQDPFLRMEQLENPQDNLRHATTLDGGRRVNRYRSLVEKLGNVSPIEDRMFAARVLEDWYANLQAVLHRNDRISMAASIESRPPFLENDLMQFAMHLPRQTKWHKGHCKWIVKKYAEPKLPREIVHAPKLQFPVDMYGWKHVAPILKDGLCAQLFKWGRSETDRIIKHASDMPTVIHNLIGVELWSRLYLNGESPDNLGEEVLRISGHQNDTAQFVSTGGAAA